MFYFLDAAWTSLDATSGYIVIYVPNGTNKLSLTREYMYQLYEYTFINGVTANKVFAAPGLYIQYYLFFIFVL